MTAVGGPLDSGNRPDPARAAGPDTAEAHGERTRIWRQGTWLFFATVLNSGQGVIFWAVASRIVSASAIGFAASLLSLAALASAIALFGLDQSLIRFLPEVRDPRRLFAIALLLTGIAAGAVGALSVVLVYTQVHSAPEELVEVLPFAGASLGALAVAFRLSNVLVLSAGRSGWVMLQSTILGVGKIVLLPILVAGIAAGASAILLSFGASYVVAVLAGTLAGLAMWPMARTGARDPTPGEIARFSLGNYASTNLWTLPDRIAPSLVLIFFSAAATSYFYYGQLVALTIFYFPESICTSAFAHAALRRESTAHRMRSLAPALTVITVALASLTVVFAPWILWVLGGPGYAAHANLLRIYALSTIPQAGVFYLQSVYNVERRMRELVGVGTVSGVGILGALGVLLALHAPLDYIPLAWVAGNGAGLAAGLAFRPAGSPRPPGPPRTLASVYSTLVRPGLRDAYELVLGFLNPRAQSAQEAAAAEGAAPRAATGTPEAQEPRR